MYEKQNKNILGYIQIYGIRIKVQNSKKTQPINYA